MASEPLYGMYSNTQRQLEAYQFATQPDFIIGKDTESRTITVSGIVNGRMAHDAVSPENGVKDQFQGHFAPNDMQVEIIHNRPFGNPDSFRVILTGTAYEHFVAGEKAAEEIEASGKKPEFVKQVMLRHAYAAVNKPDYTLSELPGLGGGTITINGPINHRIQCGMQAHFAELFGKEGLEVELSPRHEPQHFTARFTGAAYAKLKAAQAAHEAKEPAAIGH